jgi:hypothetical protein
MNLFKFYIGNSLQIPIFYFHLHQKMLSSFFSLLVGAPFAQTSQRRLQKTGAVYGCEVDQNLCVEILFDQKGWGKTFLKIIPPFCRK